jgi:hypothetical protein
VLAKRGGKRMNGDIRLPDEPQIVELQPPLVYVKEAITWEYKRIVRNLAIQDPLNEEELNRAGADSWELAAVLHDAPLAYYYLKRVAG